MVIPDLLLALAVAAAVAAGEAMHGRRVRRVGHLAFGPSGRAARWTAAVPALRTAAAFLAALGLLFLARYDPIEIDRRPSKAASKHLLVLLDASPSMQVKDAGPIDGIDGGKQSRAAWAGAVAQGILDRLDMETTRITIVAFYTEALPIVQDTFDKEVIRNALDGLPMYIAFQPGATNVQKGLEKGFEIARPWPRASTTLVVLSDGDSNATTPPSYVPSSIADTIVIGVGDPIRTTTVGGHSSRQDTMSLRQLASRLRGSYHDGNRKHLPSEVLNRLTMIAPRATDRWSPRDLALAAAGIGCFTLALSGPALMLFGRSRGYSLRSPQRSRERTGAEPVLTLTSTSPGRA